MALICAPGAIAQQTCPAGTVAVTTAGTTFIAGQVSYGLCLNPTNGLMTINGSATGSGSGAFVWGFGTGTLSAQTDLQTALNNKLGLHATADLALALAATPTICSSGSAPRGTLVNGNATGCQVIPAATTPASPANSIQFNNASTFGGSSDFTFLPGSGVPIALGTTLVAGNRGNLIGNLDSAFDPRVQDFVEAYNSVNQINGPGIFLTALGVISQGVDSGQALNVDAFSLADGAYAIGAALGATSFGNGSQAYNSFFASVGGATSNAIGIQVSTATQAGATNANLIDMELESPFVGGGSTILQSIALLIDSQTAASTNYAIKTGAGLVLFGDKTSAPAYSGSGTAAFAPQTGAGTGATAVCATSHICDSFSGEVTLTSGTVGTPATGTQLIITFGTTRTNQPNCAVDVEGGTTFLGVTHSASTTTLTISAGVALVFGTAYAVTYVCGGQ